ncbi:putative UDP-rhamnose:rhamnosyltransferase 1 [Nymphaea colorata]|nr:putative UDP-rhamnose:rhamnosyltransferase 1 [Nymphaea colorata]
MASVLHIVLLPWSAFGHLLPFFELSKCLALKGLKVSYVSTPGNLKRLPPVPSNLEKLINLVQLPLLSEGKLPENAEATIDMPLEKVQYLKKAYDGLKDLFEKVVVHGSPDWIVHDFVPSWVLEIADKYRVPTVFFSVFSAATLAFLGPPEHLQSRTSPKDFAYAPQWFTFPTSIKYTNHEAVSLCSSLNQIDASGRSSAERLQAAIRGCKFVAIRTCREFECRYVDLLNQLYKKPVVPVGILPTLVERRTNSSTEDTLVNRTFRWLDKQRPGTVLFVGFGSEYRMTREEIQELAYGLELSGLHFIWVLRKPPYVNDENGVLPNGFEERTRSHGVICINGWVPQVEILAHKAIGGCLFHSGWGTIIESLQFGHAMILLPMMADQGLNARLLVEKGIGVEVERKEDGTFTREGMAKAVRYVMVEDEGKVFRVRARQMKAIFSNQRLHDDYQHNFVCNLYNYAHDHTNV